MKVSHVAHVKIAGQPTTYCAWPWMGGMHNFGGGEITVAFLEGPSRYESDEDVNHYKVESRSKAILRRSLDHGETWPEDLQVVIFDNSVPLERLIPEGKAERPAIDMSRPESILYCGRSLVSGQQSSQAVWIPPQNQFLRPVTFIVRSPDKGATWEKSPIVIAPFQLDHIWGFTQYLKMPDGSLLHPLIGCKHPDYHRHTYRPVLYKSTDDGLNWYPGPTIWKDPQDEIFCSYPRLVLLPSGRLLCTLGFWEDPQARVRWMGLTHSDDGGLTWSEPARIGWWGVSPYPLRLRDGRIVLIYAWRLHEPYGIRGRLSEDDGQTWSEEFIIRDYGASPDLGYPVATELDDGRIFTAYYFNVEEDGGFGGGPRHIAGSVFKIE